MDILVPKTNSHLLINPQVVARFDHKPGQPAI
jgi:hypothetical protein